MIVTKIQMMNMISWTWLIPISHQLISRCQTSPTLRSPNPIPLTPITTQLLSTPPVLQASLLHPKALPLLQAPILRLEADQAKRPLLSLRNQASSIHCLELIRKTMHKEAILWVMLWCSSPMKAIISFFFWSERRFLASLGPKFPFNDRLSKKFTKSIYNRL